MKVKGFTLLEVMVALAIFAVAALALTQVAHQYNKSTYNSTLKTKGQFVALNEQALMEINRAWLTGTESKQVTQQGLTWQIDKASQATASANVQRIEIQVSLFNKETAKPENKVANLVFFNHRVAMNEQN
jgi:general secretion pathway protein I